MGVTIGFTIGTPLWLPELPRLLSDLAGIARHYREEGHPGAESSRPVLFYWDTLNKEAPLMAWAMLGGGLLALVRRSRAEMLLLALVIPFMLQLNSVRVVFVRNFVPLAPFACLLAATTMIGLAGLLATFVRNRLPRSVALNNAPDSEMHRHTPYAYIPALIQGTIVALVIAQPLVTTAHDGWLLAQPTTRVLATQWVRERAPIGARIWLEDQTLILPPTLRVEGGRPLTTHTPAWYRERGYRFLVANMSIAKSDIALLAAFGEPAVRFEAAGQRHGHVFVIYDTGVGDAARESRTPSGAMLGRGAVMLDGYNHLDTAVPGSVLRLALYWRVERQLDHDYVVFVHLVDAQGTKQAQRDTPPLDGSRPTTTWQAGELIRDDQDLPLPESIPPGHYSLLVGMYDAVTLVSINDSGPIGVGEVDIR